MEKTEDSGEKPSGLPINISGETVFWAVAVLAILVGGFYVHQNYYGVTGHYVNGVNIYAQGNLKSAIAGVFAPTNITVELAADNTTDKTLSCEALALAKASLILSLVQKNVTAQGIVGGQYCVNANDTVIPCSHASLLVQKGPCDCMKVDSASQQVVLEGSDSWLCTYAANASDAIGWALS